MPLLLSAPLKSPSPYPHCDPCRFLPVRQDQLAMPANNGPVGWPAGLSRHNSVADRQALPLSHPGAPQPSFRMTHESCLRDTPPPSASIRADFAAALVRSTVV